MTLQARSVQVDAGSSINADGQGYISDAGPGAGSGGGSYGGAGGNASAATVPYGSAAMPVDLGSGGAHFQYGGSNGGGAIRLIVTAPSNLDLTVTAVQGPSTATVGAQASLTWTVTNMGSGTVYGQWHDAIYLANDPDTNPVETLAGVVQESAGVVLGPGATYSASGIITVPGTTVGPHVWEVKTNVLGEVFEGAHATEILLALNPGVAGSVQLFVGGGYLPSPSATTTSSRSSTRPRLAQ